MSVLTAYMNVHMFVVAAEVRRVCQDLSNWHCSQFHVTIACWENLFPFQKQYILLPAVAPLYPPILFIYLFTRVYSFAGWAIVDNVPCAAEKNVYILSDGIFCNAFQV